MASALHLAFFYSPKPRPRCLRPEVPVTLSSSLCCPVRCPRRRTQCHQGTQTQRHRSVVERLGPHLGRGIDAGMS